VHVTGTDRYWNPLLETMPRDRLQEVQFRKLKRMVEFAYERSGLYRQTYQQAGFEPGDLKTIEDAGRIPKVEKGMLRDVQCKDPFPYGDALCVPLERVTEFRQTSGTTGQPVYQGDTWQDWEWWAESWAYLLYAQGYRDTDRVFLPFGYNIFVAFWAAHYAGEKLGCEIVPGGVLDTEARLLKMKELQVSALMATPTYVLGMAEAAKGLGIDPVDDLSVRRITCAGEPGASIPATKRRMEEAWGAKVYDHCGATEIGAWGFECTEQSGGIHVNEALFLAQVEDLETGELVEEPGRRGRLVITALDRIGMPCIRFDSKDVVEWADEPCSCGRTFRLFKGGVVGRADDITKVKGVLLAPSAIEEVVRSFCELGDEYEVTVTKKGDLDEISLVCELAPEYCGNQDELREQLKDRLRVTTNLGYKLSLVDCGELPRYALKAKRFKDLRKQGEEVAK
jgi:phenylacetate-CoA ligase